MYIENRKLTVASVFLISLLFSREGFTDCSDILKYGIFDNFDSVSNRVLLKETQNLYCRSTSRTDTSASSQGLDLGFLVDDVKLNLGLVTGQNSGSISNEEACQYDWDSLQLSNNTISRVKSVNSHIVTEWRSCMDNQTFSFSIKRSPDRKLIQLTSKLNTPTLYNGTPVLLDLTQGGVNVSPAKSIDCGSVNVTSLASGTGATISCQVSEANLNKDLSIDLNTNYGNKSIFVVGYVVRNPAPQFRRPNEVAIEVSNTTISPDAAWHEKRCPSGFYISSVQMKAEPRLGGKHDDTAANGFRFYCRNKQGSQSNLLTPSDGPFGIWGTQFAECPMGQFLSSFSLNVEAHVGRGNSHDDTAVNWLKFGCRSFDSVASARQNVPPNIQIAEEHGWPIFGTWGEAAFCPALTAACGIKQRFEGKQGDGDDISLYDVSFICCDATDLLR